MYEEEGSHGCWSSRPQPHLPCPRQDTAKLTCSRCLPVLTSTHRASYYFLNFFELSNEEFGAHVMETVVSGHQSREYPGCVCAVSVSGPLNVAGGQVTRCRLYGKQFVDPGSLPLSRGMMR